MEMQESHGVSSYLKYLLTLGILYSKRAWKNFSCKNDAHYRYLELEQPATNFPDKTGIDSIQFIGASTSGVYFQVCFGRRNDNSVDTYFILQLSDIDPDILVSPKLPETRLPCETMDEFSADGLRITCIIPMKQWRIEYNGVMKGFKNTQSIYMIHFDVIWTDWSDVIDLNDLRTPQVIAMEQARKDSWSFVIDDGKDGTVNYQQVGETLGRVSINGAEFDLCLKAIRERCYGFSGSDWQKVYRLVKHSIVLQNGDVLYICSHQMEKFSKTFTNGYIFRRNLGLPYTFTDCSLQLDACGNKGKPPEDYSFVVVTGIDIQIKIDILVQDTSNIFLGADWESRLVIQFCQCEVRGVFGRGIVEWLYQNDKGRSYPVTEAIFDPRDIIEFYDNTGSNSKFPNVL